MKTVVKKDHAIISLLFLVVSNDKILKQINVDDYPCWYSNSIISLLPQPLGHGFRTIACYQPIMFVLPWLGDG